MSVERTEKLVQETYPQVSLGVEEGLITVIKIDGKTFSLHNHFDPDTPVHSANRIIDMIRDFHYAQNSLREIQ